MSYRKISGSLEARESGLNFPNRPEIAFQILERCDHYNTKPRVIETSRDLKITRLTA